MDMKKTLFQFAFASCLLLLFHYKSVAQNAEMTTSKPANNFYFEVLGSSLIYSFNNSPYAEK